MKRVSPALVAAMIATIVSIAAFCVFYIQGSTLGYKDVFSHLEIGRRMIAGQSTGFGQLGGIWLPLQHLLMIPLVWSDALYLSGIAGSVLSMGAYVVSVWAVFRIVYNLTSPPHLLAAWLAAAVFGLNPNLLYIQSTPMGETIMYASILLTVLGLIRWVQTDRYQYLLLASLSAFALTLVRYEGWITAVSLIGVVGYVCVRKGYALVKGDQKAQGLTLAFAFLPAIGVGGWMLWNQLIFGDWLNWLRGQYSSQDQVSTLILNQVGNPVVAALTYWYGMVHILTIPLVVMAVIALVVMLIREKVSPIMVVVLSTFAPGAFLVYGLYSGGQPMQVMEIDGSIYNLRFGVVMLIPVSILIGYLVSVLPQKFYIGAAAAMAGCAMAVGFLVVTFASDTSKTIITNREAHEAVTVLTEQRELSTWLSENTSGRILIQSFENERVVFDVQDRIVYEGNPAWETALNDPNRANIGVVVMRTANPDGVYKRLNNAPTMGSWSLVRRTDSYDIYSQKG